MLRTELLSTAVGAFAFALTFHAESAALRLISAGIALLTILYVQQSPRAGISWLLGTLAMLGCYFWMGRVSPVFFHVGAGWGYLILTLFSIFEGGVFYAAHFLSSRLKKYSPNYAIPLSWFTVQLIYPHIIPWDWANLFLDCQPLVLSVGLFGTAIFSPLLLIVCTPIFNRSRRTVVVAIASLSILLAASSIQARSLSRREAEAAKIRVGMVQSNLDPARDFRPEKRFENIETQRRISEKLLGQDLDLLVWSESAVHFDYPTNLKHLAPTSQAHPFPGLSVPILFGTQTRLGTSNEKGEPLYYFSGLLLGIDGEVLGRYDKRRLLPFAEMVPFSSLFPGLKSMLPSGFELQAGTGPRNLELAKPQKHEIAVSICYEDLFSSAFSAGVAPSFLLSLTNDAWFLDSEASEQHYQLSRLRAIEQGRYFVRVTTNGVSAVVAPNGAEVFRLPLRVAEAAVVEVPLL